MSTPIDNLKIWETQLPFPRGFLGERDYFGSDWHVVFEDDRRTLVLAKYGYQHMLWVEIVKENAVFWEHVPQDKIRPLLCEYAYFITDWHRRFLEKVFVPGVHVPTVLHQKIYGRHRWSEEYTRLRTDVDDSQTQRKHLYRLTSLRPLRFVYIEFVTDTSDNVLFWRVYEGATAIALEEEMERS